MPRTNLGAGDTLVNKTENPSHVEHAFTQARSGVSEQGDNYCGEKITKQGREKVCRGGEVAI